MKLLAATARAAQFASVAGGSRATLPSIPNRIDWPLPSNRQFSSSRPWRSSMPSSRSSSSSLPQTPFPIFTQIADYRRWRRFVRREAILASPSITQDADAEPDSVGFVPTMGALHAGHIDLVRHSLRENLHTVVSIFVNPAQFAPTEDLSSYPRTLESDIASLVELQETERIAAAASGEEGSIGQISAIFCPTVKEMYPSLPGTDTPFTQHVAQQQGAFIEVQGLSNVLEGKSRPGFFRGVATVVTKLWHVVEPSRVYFGQKDIQQAIILRALLTSLLFQHPSSLSSSSTFRVIPTGRDPATGLALSSRNAYLKKGGREWAPTLFQALSKAQEAFTSGDVPEAITSAAIEHVQSAISQAAKEGAKDKDEVRLELDYISLNTATTLAEIPNGPSGREVMQREGAILSGAMWVVEGEQRTRLIDNLLLGKAAEIIAA